MDHLLIELLKNAGPNAGLLFLGYLAVNKIIKDARAEIKTELKDIIDTLKQNTKEVHALNVAMAKAETKFEMLDRAQDALQKNTRDINMAFEQLRLLQQGN